MQVVKSSKACLMLVVHLTLLKTLTSNFFLVSGSFKLKETVLENRCVGIREIAGVLNICYGSAPDPECFAKNDVEQLSQKSCLTS